MTNNHVILNLFQDLINKRFRNEFGMTEITCQPELVSGSSKVFKTEFDMSKTKKHAAFTLAEVLITLAIIGIVAALTIPTLVTKYQKKQTVSGLKEAYSILSNAAKLSEAENGPMSTWTFPKFSDSDSTGEFVKKYYLPYLRSAKLFSRDEFEDEHPKYSVKNLSGDERGHMIYYQMVLLSNGMMLFFNSAHDTGYFWIYADINGLAGPNRIGHDIFVFDGNSWGKKGNSYINFWNYPTCTNGRDCLTQSGPEEGSDDAELNFGYYGCSKDNKYGYYAGYYCGALIQYDGWKIADDYPW